MIRYLTLAMLVMLASCASTSGPTQDTTAVPEELVQRHLDLGIGYLRNGDYKRAKEKLNRALDINPRSSAVHATYGLLFQLEGEDKLAEEYFVHAIRLDPESASARNSYGAFLFSQQRYNEAIEQLSLAAENRFYGNRPTVFENLGVAYSRVGDMASADSAFNRAIQLNPEQSRALLELSVIRFGQAKYVESRELYLRHKKVAGRSAKSLLLCIKLARIFKNADEEASCVVALEGIYPASPEYREYQEALSGR